MRFLVKQVWPNPQRIQTWATKKLFKWSNDMPYLWKYEFQNLPNTKFYKKAKKSNRQSFFIALRKI